MQAQERWYSAAWNLRAQATAELGAWRRQRTSAGSVPITVTVDSRKLEPGVHNRQRGAGTNDADYPLIIVPVTVMVPCPL